MTKNNQPHFINHNKLLKLLKNHDNYVVLINKYVGQKLSFKSNKSRTKKQRK